MEDIWRDDLEGDGPAEAGGDARRFVGVRRKPVRGSGKPERLDYFNITGHDLSPLVDCLLGARQVEANALVLARQT
jgi:uncharacterized protein involved in copper resistance